MTMFANLYHRLMAAYYELQLRRLLQRARVAMPALEQYDDEQLLEGFWRNEIRRRIVAGGRIND